MRYADGRIDWKRNPEMAADMADLCGRMSEPHVMEAMRERWGVELTPGQVGGFKARRGIRNGLVGGRFEKGNVPSNKGKTWDDFMSPEAQERSRMTLFRPGERRGKADESWRPVGSETTRSDGTVWVKVSDEVVSIADYGSRNAAARARMGRWRLRSHVNYESAYGPVPEGCVVVHADHDPSNDDPGNLVAVPRKLRSTIEMHGTGYADRETLEVAVLAAEVRQAAYRAGRSVA